MDVSKVKQFTRYIALFVFIFLLSGCNDDWLVREPTDIITQKQVWNDTQMIDGLLANYYDRLPKHASLTDGWPNPANFTNSMWSGQNNDEWRNNLPTYGYGWWSLWDYGLIRDLNLALQNIDKYSTSLSEDQKKAYKAEFRFLRAYVYFEEVKRMGGVPIITKPIEYDGNDVKKLQKPRNTEAEVYDFIGNELDAVVDMIGSTNAGSQTRANKYTALALKSRAMLYAGSIAKYNNQMANPITTSGNEVGIPAGRAQGYYQKALDAAEKVINNSPYSLYRKNPDPAMNFYEAVTKKEGNNEVIFAEDFSQSADRRHWFAYDNIARPARQDNLGSSSITPTLNLVEAYDYLDGSSGELKTRKSNGDYVYYDSVQEIFENKDPRLMGTVVLPGSSFRGVDIDMQAGVKVWDDQSQSYETEEGDRGSTYDDGGVLTAIGGPDRTSQNVSNTGFYLRKLVSNKDGASKRNIRSVNWWPYIRLGEIYLNAAEAAFELGQNQKSLDYINTIRERAGFGANSLTSISFEKIRKERRVELAFEDHRLWDLKRWRLAHKVWDGNADNETSIPMALYPYRVVNPGDSTDGKYVFEKMKAPRIKAPRKFRMGNYYSAIPQGVLNANPELVRNPFH